MRYWLLLLLSRRAAEVPLTRAQSWGMLQERLDLAFLAAGLAGGEHKYKGACLDHGPHVLGPVCEGTSRLLG